jgi:hypothetical protein
MKKNLLFVLIIPILLFIGLKKKSASFFSVKEYKCIAPELLSFNYFSCIHSALGKMLAENVTAYELIDQLKKQFPVLDKIIISYRPSVVHVEMSIYEPICCINNQIVLTSHNDLFPKDFFSEGSVADVPKIAVLLEDMNNVPFFVSSLLRELPYNFNQFYNLELIDGHCVRLIDKQKSNFIIIFTVDQEKSPLLLAQCELVKKNIAERRGFNKEVKWIADTRFAHYIVIYKA